MRRALVATVLAALLAGALAGCEPKTERDCKAASGTWQKTGQHSARCLPPRGGWQ